MLSCVSLPMSSALKCAERIMQMTHKKPKIQIRLSDEIWNMIFRMLRACTITYYMEILKSLYLFKSGCRFLQRAFKQRSHRYWTWGHYHGSNNSGQILVSFGTLGKRGLSLLYIMLHFKENIVLVREPRYLLFYAFVVCKRSSEVFCIHHSLSFLCSAIILAKTEVLLPLKCVLAVKAGSRQIISNYISEPALNVKLCIYFCLHFLKNFFGYIICYKTLLIVQVHMAQK